MRRLVWVLLTLLPLTVAASALNAESPSDPATPWKFETVYLKNGAVLLGLVTEETQQLIRFQNVRRAPGRPTVIIYTTFKRGEIAKVDRLPDEDHKKLEDHVHELEQNTPQGEKERMGGLELTPVAWGMN